MPAPRSTYTFKLTPEQQVYLTELLNDGTMKPLKVEHASAAASGGDANVVLYKSGKCVVQGKGAEEWVQFKLEPLVLQQARAGYENVWDPTIAAAHMGVDESGKGDFFGPLVIAAAYVDETIVPQFQELNVRDSKTITTDRMAEKMARDIVKILGRRFTVIKIGPRTYNRLYAKMRSVNTMLAWGHARAIENLLEQVPGCPRAISDQFGPSNQIERALMEKGRQIELIQRTKAESDPAVAAASILARAGFIQALKEMGQLHGGITIPKGASPQVKAAAIELVKAKGPKVLLDTAKCHFKTADEVLASAGHARSDLGPEGQAMSKAFVRKGKSAS